MISTLFPPVMRTDETGDGEVVKHTRASFTCARAWNKSRFHLVHLLINNQFLHMTAPYLQEGEAKKKQKTLQSC